MQKEKKDKHFIQKPVYKGGKKNLKDFITKALKYPEAALNEKIEGTVVIKYTVNHLGKVIDSKVISGIGHGCDEEAQRVVGLLRFDVPKTRGLKVLHHLNIQIHFRLPKVTNKTVASKTDPAPVTYNYIQPEKKAHEKPKKSSYNYTITIHN